MRRRAVMLRAAGGLGTSRPPPATLTGAWTRSRWAKASMPLAPASSGTPLRGGPCSCRAGAGGGSLHSPLGLGRAVQPKPPRGAAHTLRAHAPACCEAAGEVSKHQPLPGLVPRNRRPYWSGTDRHLIVHIRTELGTPTGALPAGDARYASSCGPVRALQGPGIVGNSDGMRSKLR